MYYCYLNDTRKYILNNVKELNNIVNKDLVIEIDISNYGLRKLPKCINEFINLQNFYCNNNNLSTLEELNLPNLQIIYCSYNNLTNIKHLNSIKSLLFINCSYNKITSIEELNLPNLQHLSCSNNELITLGYLNTP